MSGGVIYSNASIIMQSDTKLLTKKRIREMVAANERAALLRVLEECGYQTNFNDDAALIENERRRTLQTFLDLCEDEALAKCVTAWNQLDEDNAAETFQTIAANVPHIKAANLREFFTTLADVTNLRTFDKGGKTMVAGGTLDRDQLKVDLQMDASQREAALQKRLDALAEIDKDDIFKPNPLFWWYVQKQKELNVVKIILVCRRFNYDTTILRTALGGLYEQFK